MPNNTQSLPYKCTCPHSEPWLSSLPPQETLQDQQVGLAQASVESLLLLCDPVCTGPLRAPSKSGVSVSPSSVAVCN